MNQQPNSLHCFVKMSDRLLAVVSMLTSAIKVFILFDFNKCLHIKTF